MGCWDELCLLCGVCCGPAYLQVLSRRHVAEEAEAIAYEISSGNVELVEIIKEALLSSDDGTRRLGTRPWQPKGLARNGYADDFIAVGCFDDDNTGFAPIRDGKAPRGEHVEVRKVDSIRSGRFTDIIVTRDGKRVTKSWIHLSNCSARFPESISNIWLHSRCYRYLENWLDWENLLPPSDASFSGRPPLSFASELYEIINSRKFQRSE
ncbi:uncharacterized protein PHACADRAFT_262052 [Phanerochaete carnosa HHB-10118-sp]|uniref:Uncharacterized protein n=1 Tax=Phanerochaete carnosa (strain HHB-10118-sp) TaxID=650164 RepID=K5VY48_PHACS|nr:uncharacterized protein PHACADRAFT_262052 [Phanerochaete carnosa HHB-10118-sp]EKM51740.1 hypothetical protein PHACADRAFT_262052 [Phanerochaete carnosa HHB-10118-sp]